MREPIDALRSFKKYVAMALGDDWEVRLAYEEGTFTRPFCRVETAGDAIESGGRYEGETVLAVQALCHPAEQATADEAVIEAERVRGVLRAAFRVGAGAIPPPSAVQAALYSGALAAGTYSYRVTARTRFGESVPTPAVSVALALPGGVELAWTAAPGARGYRVYRGPAGAERVLADVVEPELIDDGTRRTGALVRAQGTGTLGQPYSVPLWNWNGVAFEASSSARLEPDFMRVRGLTTNRIADPTDPVRQAVVAAMRLAWRSAGARPPERAQLDEVVVAGLDVVP
jgi:hypothetical protein